MFLCGGSPAFFVFFRHTSQQPFSVRSTLPPHPLTSSFPTMFALTAAPAVKAVPTTVAAKKSGAMRTWAATNNK